MKELKKIMLRDAARALTPVYVPGETYAFVINADQLFTDPNYTMLGLRIVNANSGNIVADNFAILQFAFPHGLSSPIYQIFARFAFPYGIQNGQHRFEIYSAAEDITLRNEETGMPLLSEDGDPLMAESYSARLTSNVILVENDITKTTSQISFRHNADFYGTFYDAVEQAAGAPFRQIFRLPLSQIDLQFESEKKTYRNISDRKLRTIRSYRDANVKFIGINFDDEGHEALSAAIEHDDLEIDGVPVEPKTALTINTNPAAILNSSNFDGYATFEERHGTYGAFGDNIIICGNATSNPETIIQP